jgi:hypothetical protein
MIFQSGDLHWARQHPERVKRGDEHYMRRYPELVRRGEDHGQAKLSEAHILEDPQGICAPLFHDEGVGRDLRRHRDTDLAHRSPSQLDARRMTRKETLKKAARLTKADVPARREEHGATGRLPDQGRRGRAGGTREVPQN